MQIIDDDRDSQVVQFFRICRRSFRYTRPYVSCPLRNYEGFRGRNRFQSSRIFPPLQKKDSVGKIKIRSARRISNERQNLCEKKKKKKTSRLPRARSCSRLLVSNLGILNASIRRKIICAEPARFIEFFKSARPLRTSALFFRFFASFFANFSGNSMKFF